MGPKRRISQKTIDLITVDVSLHSLHAITSGTLFPIGYGVAFPSCRRNGSTAGDVVLVTTATTMVVTVATAFQRPKAENGEREKKRIF